MQQILGIHALEADEDAQTSARLHFSTKFGMR
jgi:hypothetical protein